MLLCLFAIHLLVHLVHLEKFDYCKIFIKDREEQFSKVQFESNYRHCTNKSHEENLNPAGTPTNFSINVYNGCENKVIEYLWKFPSDEAGSKKVMKFMLISLTASVASRWCVILKVDNISSLSYSFSDAVVQCVFYIHKDSQNAPTTMHLFSLPTSKNITHLIKKLNFRPTHSMSEIMKKNFSMKTKHDYSVLDCKRSVSVNVVPRIGAFSYVVSLSRHAGVSRAELTSKSNWSFTFTNVSFGNHTIQISECRAQIIIIPINLDKRNCLHQSSVPPVRLKVTNSPKVVDSVPIILYSLFGVIAVASVFGIYFYCTRTAKGNTPIHILIIAKKDNGNEAIVENMFGCLQPEIYPVYLSWLKDQIYRDFGWKYWLNLHFNEASKIVFINSEAAYNAYHSSYDEQCDDNEEFREALLKIKSNFRWFSSKIQRKKYIMVSFTYTKTEHILTNFIHAKLHILPRDWEDFLNDLGIKDSKVDDSKLICFKKSVISSTNNLNYTGQRDFTGKYVELDAKDSSVRFNNNSHDHLDSVSKYVPYFAPPDIISFTSSMLSNEFQKINKNQSSIRGPHFAQENAAYFPDLP